MQKSEFKQGIAPGSAGIEKLHSKAVFRSMLKVSKFRKAAVFMQNNAMSVARWIQAERYVSKYGSLAMHPTVKSPITSPYVTMSQNYIKQITNTWYQIYTIVKDSGNDITSGGVTDDPMEKLLRSREVK